MSDEARTPDDFDFTDPDVQDCPYEGYRALRDQAPVYRDPRTGHLRKRLYGGWVLPAFRLLAALKGLRGTAFDPFGHTAERRRERALIGEYEATVEELLAGLDESTHARAVEIAELPLAMRGFGHVKADNIRRAKEREARLLAAFRSPAPGPAE